MLSFDRIIAREPNWARLAGPDRYADAFLQADIDSEERFPTEPLFELVRDPYATDDTKATAAAAAALARALHLVPQGELVAPLASQFELYDVIAVTLGDAYSSLVGDGSFRIVERGADYRRDPGRGAPAYNSVFGLARR